MQEKYHNKALSYATVAVKKILLEAHETGMIQLFQHLKKFKIKVQTMKPIRREGKKVVKVLKKEKERHALIRKQKKLMGEH